MNLEFKGLIDKKDLERDINRLDQIVHDNDYAIIVENGAGKYVVFDIDYVVNQLDTKLNNGLSSRIERSQNTLVESMIKTLEELPTRKATAKELSFMVEKYYHRKISAIVIRTRAEENANNKGDNNYFTIEPGNVIGLCENVTFQVYMKNKMRRAIDLHLSKLLKTDEKVSIHSSLLELRTLFSNPEYREFAERLSHDELIDIVLLIGKYAIVDDSYIVEKGQYHVE